MNFLELESDDPQELLAELERRGWGDGLPVIPPTLGRVDAMLGLVDASSIDAKATATSATDTSPTDASSINLDVRKSDASDFKSDLDPDEVISTLEPRYGQATRRTIAINAVMAGCLPEHLEVLVAAVRALGAKEFNLRGVNATTHPCAPLVIVHGECAERLGFACKAGAFGPASRANATIGRAIRLILLHVAGAVPGDTDASTQGQPSKYTYCVAENTAASPWESLPHSRGVLAPSSVTVFAGENPHNFHDMESDSPEVILDKAASVMATLGCNNAPIGQGEFFIGLCPEHAATIAQAGWQRQDVKMYLYERARRPIEELRRHFDLRAWRPWQENLPEGALAPMTCSPDNIEIFVVGGAGKHSCVIPSWGMTRSVTLPVEF